MQIKKIPSILLITITLLFSFASALNFSENFSLSANNVSSLKKNVSLEEKNEIAYKEIQGYFRSILLRRLSFKFKRVIKHPLRELRNL